MIIKEYIRNFEKHGMGMFVHFGLYSAYGKGEWILNTNQISAEEYSDLRKQFCPEKDWAQRLVSAAKKAGCRYITLTTRHHDGFSLFDTQGLSEYDAPHSCGRDLVREFVDACREKEIIPFFYHTLLDWHAPTFHSDFKAYLVYLRQSVELLCKNYGEIGGIWFDGKWSKKEEDWEEDALYGLIRSYQPNAMIINNTGLGAQGALGHIELDSVTFERGKPRPINLKDSPKYIASEMCQIFADHWGYAKRDFDFKSPASIIEDLACCRRYGANFLINVGPMGNGYLRKIDEASLELLGEWVEIYEEALRLPRPMGVDIADKPKDFLLQDGNSYYLFCHDLSVKFDENVSISGQVTYADTFSFPVPVRSVRWMDNGKDLKFTQENGILTVETEPYVYGVNYVVRVAKIET